MAILFFTNGTTFNLSHPRRTTSWIKKVIHAEKQTLESLSYVFCNDKFLNALNSRYLHHKSLTDILTFNFSEKAGAPIEGEIYISIPRIKENARKYGEQFERELDRVIIHGVLHLLGYRDKTPSEKTLMRKKEEAYLSLHPFHVKRSVGR